MKQYFGLHISRDVKEIYELTACMQKTLVPVFQIEIYTERCNEANSYASITTLLYVSASPYLHIFISSIFMCILKPGNQSIESILHKSFRCMVALIWYL